MNARQIPGAAPQPPEAAIPYFVADGTGRTGYHAGDRELAVWALAAWQRSVGPALRFEAAPEARALLRVHRRIRPRASTARWCPSWPAIGAAPRSTSGPT